MLRTDLIELVNGTAVWAFVGSGASAPAGVPTWGGLLEEVAASFDERDEIGADPVYRSGLARERYETSFSAVERIVGRGRLEAAVTTAVDRAREPGPVIRQLADWPFAGYITTNYDRLIEGRLRAIGTAGWQPVGNSLDEVRKLAGEPRDVVWHIHGAVHEPSQRFRLALTEEDYDELYREGSPLVAQLRALLLQRRVLFVGFGFRDAEMERVLKAVGRVATPLRPAFAFMSGVSGAGFETEGRRLFEKFNVDVIPYRARGADHSELVQLMSIYGALTLRRTLRFGQPKRVVPSYDPETTSLLTYNSLVLRNNVRMKPEVIDLLAEARILALVKFNEAVSLRVLQEDLRERVRLLQHEGSAGAPAADAHDASIEETVTHLVEAGVLLRDENGILTLSESGRLLVDDQAAGSKLLSGQCRASIEMRTEQLIADENAVARIADAAMNFLLDSIGKRGLGVAMSWWAPRSDFQQFHVTALLQSLPDYLAQTDSPEEGAALVRVIEGVFARPEEAELRFLGAALQAQFSLSLLGYDREAVRARSRELAATCFIIDSTTMIPLLARSSTPHEAARVLTHQLEAAGATVASTDLLVEEVREHAMWVINKVGVGTSGLNVPALSAATGRAGQKSNLFLDGYLREVEAGSTSADFGAYLASSCGSPNATKGHFRAYVDAVEAEGVRCIPLDKWDGFEQEMWAERDATQREIATLRQERGSYTHERQVRAEAEVLLIVTGVRNGTLRAPDSTAENAYFVSNTRVIDRVAGVGTPVTMQPDAVRQWLSTLTAPSPDELGFLINSLQWELSERGLAIVDRRLLNVVFAPLVAASEADLEEAAAAHRALVGDVYGASPARAFESLDPLELPVALITALAQRVDDLETRVAAQQRALEATAKTARISEKDKESLALLEAKEKERQRQAGSKRRAAESRPAGRKKKRK
jgi:hypothetical protein